MNNTTRTGGAGNAPQTEPELREMKNGDGLELTGKISIVVPVYNGETVLRKCVNSLIAQTYKDLEIILVDDGSADGTAKIADGYANTDSRVKVIHKENGGVSSARNAALHASTGDYILFVDADDWIKSETCEQVLRAMQANDANICFYNLIMVPEKEKSYLRRPKAQSGACGRDRLVWEVLNDYYLCVNNKCFRREVIMDNGRIIEFDCGARILEDGLWLMSTAHNWKNGVLLSQGLGFRRLWSGSTMGDTEKRHQTDLEYMRNFRRIMPKLEAYGEKISNAAKEHFMAYSMDSIRRTTTRNDREWLKKIVYEMKQVDEDYSVYIFANIYNLLHAATKTSGQAAPSAPPGQKKSAVRRAADKLKQLVPQSIKDRLKKKK